MNANRVYSSLYCCNGPCTCCHGHRGEELWLSRPEKNPEIHLPLTQPRTTMLPNRRDAKHTQKVENPLWVDPEFASEYPCLEAFLCGEKYADGTHRSTGSISFFYKYGSLIVAVNDNDRMLGAFVSASTMSEIMFKLEEGLRLDNLDWRKKSASGHTQKPPF